MIVKEWKKLQNGSDIRGIAIDGIGNQEINLTNDAIGKIAKAFTVWLCKKTGKPVEEIKISVGNDSRMSAERLRNAIIESITSLGGHVIHCGLASTPAMFMSTVIKGYEYDGAIMITASHLPFNRNGMKFFVNEGGLDKKDITEILLLAQADKFNTHVKIGTIQKIDFISVYAEELVNKIIKGVEHPVHKEQPLKGFKIVVDAGNGAGGFFVEKVLKPLGADTTGSQFLDPDGSFPNHIPNPEDKDAMEAIKKAVIEHKADLGIIFDTDVDRAGAVDSDGNEINRNRLIALISSIVLEEHPGSTIVTDSITSSGLAKFIESDLGGKHHRFQRGYKNVINEAIRINNEGAESHLAIETSGHGALKENYFLDDGAYLIAKILIKMAKLELEKNQTIHQLISTLEEPIEEKEFRMNILVEDFKSYGEKIIADLADFVQKDPQMIMAPNNYEGIRALFDKENGDGWFLLRLSLHDPLMPINIESNIEGGAKMIASKLIAFLNNYSELDTSALEEFVQ